MDIYFEQHSMVEMTSIGMICWQLWKNKNDLIWNQRSMKASEVVDSATLILNQWQSVQDRTFDRFMGYMTPEDGDEHWNLPQLIMLRLIQTLPSSRRQFQLCFRYTRSCMQLIYSQIKLSKRSPRSRPSRSIGHKRSSKLDSKRGLEECYC